MFIISTADTLTGTPSSLSIIIRPASTSFTESASRQYFSTANHCNHLMTGGMALRWTKKPANVIWYSAVRAEKRMAIPPLEKRAPRRKFYIFFV